MRKNHRDLSRGAFRFCIYYINNTKQYYHDLKNFTFFSSSFFYEKDKYQLFLNIIFNNDLILNLKKKEKKCYKNDLI